MAVSRLVTVDLSGTGMFRVARPVSGSSFTIASVSVLAPSGCRSTSAIFPSADNPSVTRALIASGVLGTLCSDGFLGDCCVGDTVESDCCTGLTGGCESALRPEVVESEAVLSLV